jgi:hypothetical protein
MRLHSTPEWGWVWRARYFSNDTALEIPAASRRHNVAPASRRSSSSDRRPVTGEPEFGRDAGATTGARDARLDQKKNFKLNWMYLGEPLWYTVPKFVTYVFRNW